MDKKAATRIQIRAEPRDNATCRFVLDRAVFPGGSAWFESGGERAADSPMARSLLELPDVEGVLVQDEVITVHAREQRSWMPLGREIGRRIREVMEDKAPPVDPGVLEGLPAPDEIRDRVRRVLEDEINPAVASHGGWIDLVGVEKNQVFLRMGGGCQGCGMATATLRQGVERALRRSVPEIGAILDTTDHAAGQNPYYEPAR